MKTYYLILISLLGWLSLQAQVQFKIELLDDDVTYQVSLLPESSLSDATSITSTGQVTVLAPIGGFQPSNLQSINGTWDNNSTVLAPMENPGFEYYIFGLTSLGISSIPYLEGEETPLFTFENAGLCTGPLELMEANDPFTPPNSLNINAGNELLVFGYGSENAWAGNYDTGSAICMGCPKPIEYSVQLLPDGETYQVNLRSQILYEGMDALTNSAQVTLLVPTGGFELTNLESINGQWENNTTVVSPAENPSFDYLIVGLVDNGTGDIPYPEGGEVPLFTFQNNGLCTGAMELMEADDPFEAPNSQNINAGNEIVIFGYGNENAWCGNYGEGDAICDGCPKPLEYKVELLPDGETYQVYARPTVTYTGADALTNSAQVTILAPTGGFLVGSLTSINGQWENNTNVVSPVEEPGSDYLIFGLVSNGTSEITYQEGVEVPLFSFRNDGICTGPLALMEAGDPFEPPNSLNINAGNEAVIFGFGNQNAWCGNYGQGMAPCPPGVNVSLQLFLQGPYNESTELMEDQLRVNGLLPLAEPYTLLPGFDHTGGGGGETMDATVLSEDGENAIVDWVFLELRAANDSSSVVATRSALLQRDGDVVDTDGLSPIRFAEAEPGLYFLSVRHRNHLGVMLPEPVLLEDAATYIDLTDTSQDLYGVNAAMELGGKLLLWAGDANSDGEVSFQGGGSDAQYILQEVLQDIENSSGNLNFMSIGYKTSDCSMDRATVYNGQQNELELLFLNILEHPDNGSTDISFIIQQQLP